MSEYWSDEDSADTVAPDAKSRASRRSAKPPSIRTEAKHMLNSIKKKRGPDDEFVIAVVRNGSVEALEQRLPGAKSWYEPLFKKKSEVIVTSVARLQAAIQMVEQRFPLRALSIVASGEIEHIGFHVASSVRQLKLHRCGFGNNAHDDLLINGASTFRNVRLDEWEEVNPRKRRGEIWLHPGVAIAADTARGAWARIRRTSAFSDADEKSISRNLGFMEKTKMDGDGWWKNWRGPIASILGVLAGGAGFAGAVTAAAAGAYVNFAWGAMSFKAGTAAVTVTGAACGSAILLGGGVAAAVYFVPWGSLFNMLKSALSWLWDKLVSLWDKFQNWWDSCWSNSKQRGHSTPMPMMG